MRETIDNTARIEEDCMQREVFCADKGAIVFSEALAINHKGVEPSDIYTDGQKLGDNTFLLDKGQRIIINKELKRGILLTCRLRIVTLGVNEDTDFLAEAFKNVSMENETYRQKLFNYRLQKNEALRAYDAIQYRMLHKSVYLRKLVRQILVRLGLK